MFSHDLQLSSQDPERDGHMHATATNYELISNTSTGNRNLAQSTNCVQNQASKQTERVYFATSKYFIIELMLMCVVLLVRVFFFCLLQNILTAFHYDLMSLP